MLSNLESLSTMFGLQQHRIRCSCSWRDDDDDCDVDGVVDDDDAAASAVDLAVFLGGVDDWTWFGFVEHLSASIPIRKIQNYSMVTTR